MEPKERKLVKVTYHYSDGYEIEKEPWKTPLETLDEWRDSEFTLEDLKKDMVKHYGRFEAWVSAGFVYMINDLSIDDWRANEILQEWADEWALPF